MRIVVIGAGAAGCICAIELKRSLGAAARVDVFEAGDRTLAKVARTGGGRCNLTNTFEDTGDPAQVYPRGGRLMGRLFHTFSPEDTRQWFTREGIALKVEEDGRVFPVSDDAMQVVGTLRRLLREEDIPVRTRCKVLAIRPEADGFLLTIAGAAPERADAVVVTTGGSPVAGTLAALLPPDVETIPPVPSLFALNIPDKGLRALSGTTVPDTVLALSGTKIKAEGALLITFKGLSGPAALRLSSHAARILAERQYRAELRVNWLGRENAEEALAALKARSGDRLVRNAHPETIPGRLWAFLADRAGIPQELRWKDAGAKNMARLAETLRADTYPVDGKSPNGEEFVTCGGVSLAAVDPNTLEARCCPGLYFAGEVLDIDAVTGGFNLQAAWTTGVRVARSLAQKHKGD